MTEQQKQQSAQQTSAQDPQQIQILLKETLKENKSLVSKNNKLESKYVELFKQNKLLKQDRNIFTNFCSSYFADSDGKSIEEAEAGQLKKEVLEAAGEQKINAFIKKIQELENKISTISEELKNQADKEVKQLTEKLKAEWQGRIKSSKDQQNKELNSLNRELQSLRKSNELKSKELTDIKVRLDSTNKQISKISKEKLKMEHHLNNLRKRQIAQELQPPKQDDDSKTLVDKNEYLSLKQHVDKLMSKRDELRRELKKKEDELANEHRNSLAIQQQLDNLKHTQQQNSQKFQLIKECSLQQLENMILSYHMTESEKQAQDAKQEPGETNGNKQYVEIQMTEEKTKDEKVNDPRLKKRVSTEEQIKRQYLKNMVARYIKAETSGNSQQSMTLLEIIGRLVNLDGESTQNLSHYIAKHKQWWYLKY